MTNITRGDGRFRAFIAPIRQVMPGASDEEVEEAARNLIIYLDDTDLFHDALLADPELHARFNGLREEQDLEWQLGKDLEIEIFRFKRGHRR